MNRMALTPVMAGALLAIGIVVVAVVIATWVIFGH